MTTDQYIEKNKTKTLKKGDRVVMHSCGEAKHEDGKLWTCSTDSYKGQGGSELVFLEGYSGSFLVKYLQVVKLKEKFCQDSDK